MTVKTASFMGQCLQAYTEKDRSSRIRQTNYMLPIGVCQLVLLFHTAWNPLALRKEDTHSSEEQSVTSLLYI